MSDGAVVSTGIRMRKGNVHTTTEIVVAEVFADFDKCGQLLGFELLGPCRFCKPQLLRMLSVLVDDMAMERGVTMQKVLEDAVGSSCELQ